MSDPVSYTMTHNLFTDVNAYLATFYSYDIHGNVDTLRQDFKGISEMDLSLNRLKVMAYGYDLISGKVNDRNNYVFCSLLVTKKPTQAMKYYLKVLQQYAVFKGRASRSEYWYFVLFNFIVLMILNTIDVVAGTLYINTIYSLAVLVPSIAVGVRRMHDVNKSGWYILIPIYNLILACTAGTTGPNEYGQDPLRPEFDSFLQEDAVV